MAGRFYGGTSGLQTPIPKRDFPEIHQDKSRLAYYSLLFNSIEINSSFYKMPRPETLEKWAAEVHDDFRFTFKLWQGITHQKLLDFDTEDVVEFIRIIDHVGHKAGCLLIQFPPSLSIDGFRQLEKLLTLMKQFNNSWHIAVEFRHRSWYDEAVYDLLETFDAGLVIHDLPGSAAPFRETAQDFMYLRFHGPEGRYRGSYGDEQLYEYALYINEWLTSDNTVYTYFNNTMGDALKNLRTLRQYL